MVWRRLKGLGAVYLSDGVAALPDSPAAERFLRALRNEIAEFGGMGHLMRCEANRHLTYAELEENDEDLTKLKNWSAKVQSRDVVDASSNASSLLLSKRCESPTISTSQKADHANTPAFQPLLERADTRPSNLE